MEEEAAGAGSSLTLAPPTWPYTTQGMDLFPYPWYWIEAFLGAILVAWAGRYFARTPWHRAAGWGIASVPLWLSFLGILESMEGLIEGGQVLEAISARQLSNTAARKILIDVGFVGVGALIAVGGWRPWEILLRSLARRLVDAGLPMGVRSELRSMSVGVLAFPALLIGATALSYLLALLPSLNQGDESAYFSNMTPYHAVFLAAAAAFGEEIVYRGLLQQSIRKGLGGGRIAAAVAVSLQATFFAFAHAGYGNWTHVIQPFGFGLLTGFAAQRYGLWCAIALHFLIDLVVFSAQTADTNPWFWQATLVLLIANIVASVAWLAYRAMRYARERSQVA